MNVEFEPSKEFKMPPMMALDTKPDPLAVAYKQGWTAARDEWKPRTEEAETELAELRAKARQEFDLGNDWMERALTAEAELTFLRFAHKALDAAEAEVERLQGKNGRLRAKLIKAREQLAAVETLILSWNEGDAREQETGWAIRYALDKPSADHDRRRLRIP